MPALLLALALLAFLGLGIFWFLRANPSAVARILRPIVVLAGGVGVGGLLIFGVRFLPGLLPELFGLLGVLGTALIARYVRQRPSGGFSSPGAGQRTEVHTAFVEAWIDHATGDVGGRILKGRFAGRGLDMLSDSELLDLHVECAGDADSLRVLESYLDRRLGADWRKVQSPPRDPRADMTREEAHAVLGLAAGATEEEIRAAHRRLILKVHPDVGGSADLAARINRAKDVLLG
ncbi:DnaJ domain-containing protein [Reyranella sp.]|uniref:DnaJ domain-containing protein n=1 Tax=Reyranella sp. TaxID=1929291 RepID=UPI003D11FAC2